jgi:isoleucyl-tRNA synthetase
MDDDVYQDKTDNTVTVAMRIDDKTIGAKIKNKFESKEAYVVIWTTTPWTLPTNNAVAVGPKIEYVLVTPKAGDGDDKFLGKSFVLAKSRVSAFEKEFGKEPEILDLGLGKDLEGIHYFPIYDYFKAEKGGGNNDPDVDLTNAFQIHCADYVGEEDGTGLVHIAAYGEDDMFVLNEMGVIPPVPMDEGAILTSEIKDYSGMHVFDANKPITRDLREQTGPFLRIDANKRAILVREQSMTHSYPHCWRCRKPLIYRPISSWFVKVTAIKDRLLEENQKINWIPNNVKDGQFGKWLEGARDWAISRNRFWGAPIPVWVSDSKEYPRVDVYGSLSELEEDFADCLANDPEAKKAYSTGKVDNLHRPYIDTLVRPNPDDPTGKSKMKRITDVFDCWFESGSMSFAQVHYPFENKDWFENHFPADFIVEYIGQTRGWFYLMHVMAVALFDCNAFRNVMCHGIVLGNDGQKMSKSLRNYPDVNGVFDKYGSDAMRWFLMSSSILRGGNLKVTEEAIHDTVRQTLLPLWSSYYFFTLYANSSNGGAGYKAKKIVPSQVNGLNIQDRYILAKSRDFFTEVGEKLESFDIAGACEATRDFLDVLTNWYIRVNRSRFWNEEQEAFDTLWTVLEAVCRCLAPLLPLTTEEIWRGLTSPVAQSDHFDNVSVRSVHLETFPDVTGEVRSRSDDTVFVENRKLVNAIDEVRDILSVASSLRKANSQRNRQPLAELTVAVSSPDELAKFTDVIMAEVNVKAVNILDLARVSKEQFGITEQLNVNARALGPRIGKKVQEVIRASKSGDYKIINGTPLVKISDGEISLEESEFSLKLVANSENGEIAADILSSGGFLTLNLELTDELINEGLARDLIREIQDTRKKSGLEVGDRIDLSLSLTEERAKAAEVNKDLIAGEVLAKTVKIFEVEDKGNEEIVTKVIV